MGDVRQSPSTAVLMRLTSQWPAALRTTRALVDSGATVMLFFLGYAPMTVDYPMLDELGVECFADTRQKNIEYLPVDAIAAILKQCDLVIPV